MSEVFQTRRRVEFRDTDMAGIVHFSNFFAYMEQTEHAFLRSLGLGVVARVDGLEISWPRVHAECNYRQAIRFEELIDIDLRVERIGRKSVTYRFDFSRDDQPIADGRITAVCCLFEHGAKPESIEIPESFVAAIEPYRIPETA